jgi:hypothetical protein
VSENLRILQLDLADGHYVRIQKSWLRRLEQMGAVEIGDGVIVVHHTAINHDGRPPSPGVYEVITLTEHYVHAVCQDEP